MEWKSIGAGYKVSDSGLVTNKTGHFLKPRLRYGKPTYDLHLDATTRTKAIYIKDLVYQAFIGEIPLDREVYNINGDIHDNYPLNLGLREKKRRMVNYDAVVLPPLKKLNDEGTIRLWKAIVDMAVHDAAKEINERKQTAEIFLYRDAPAILGLNGRMVREAVDRRIGNVGERGERKPEVKKPNRDHLNHCKTCVYSMYISGVLDDETNSNVACGYILYKHKMRGCPAIGCERYEQKQQRKRSSF